jgi:hypothetical protein
MRTIPYIVRLGPPSLLGMLAAIAPHPNIRKLRQIAYSLYDANATLYQTRKRAMRAESSIKPDGSGWSGQGEDVISVLGMPHAGLYLSLLSDVPSVQANEAALPEDKLSEDEIISQIGYAHAHSEQFGQNLNLCLKNNHIRWPRHDVLGYKQDLTSAGSSSFAPRASARGATSCWTWWRRIKLRRARFLPLPRRSGQGNTTRVRVKRICYRSFD